MTLKTKRKNSGMQLLKKAGIIVYSAAILASIPSCTDNHTKKQEGKLEKKIRMDIENFPKKIEKVRIIKPAEKLRTTKPTENLTSRTIKTPEDLSFLDMKKKDFKDEKNVYFLEKEYYNCDIPGGNNLMRYIHIKYLTKKEIEKRDLKNRWITKNPSPSITYATEFHPEGIPIRKKPSLRGWLDSKVCSSLDLNIKYDNNIECSYSIGNLLNTKELKKDMEIFKRIVVNHMKRNNLKLPEEIIDSYKNPVNLKKYADEPDEVKTFEKEIIYNMLSIAKEFN